MRAAIRAHGVLVDGAWREEAGAGHGLGAPGAKLSADVRARVARMDRASAIAVMAADRVLPASWRGAGTPRRDVGIAIGTALGCLAGNAAHQARLVAGGAAAVSPRIFAATVSNAPAGEVSIAAGVGGPALTVAAGMAGGLAALEWAIGELGDGIEAMVVGAVDVVDAAGARWLRETGWTADTAAEQAVMLVLTRASSSGADAVAIGGIGTAFVAAPCDGAIAGAIRCALAQARLQASDVQRVVVRGAHPAEVEAVLGVGTDVHVPPRASGLLAAGSLVALLDVVRVGPGPCLVVDRCPSGHAGAVVAWSPAG